MTLPSADQQQYSVTRTLYLKNKAPMQVNLSVPPEQAWLYVMLEDQTKTLGSINGKLTFFVVLAILAIVLSLFLR